MSLDKESVVVITGAGSGIGRSLALEIAKEKIRGIAVSDVDQNGLDETVELAKKTAVDIFALNFDVSNRDAYQDFASQTIDKFGTATHLINNAGVGLIGRTDEVSFEDIEWLMGINFWGTVYGTKIFLPVFLEQNSGHIVNISSVFGFIAPPRQAAYCASKFAVRGFTESLRHELAGTGVSVSCVHPGGIKTNIAKQARLGENASKEDKRMAPIILEKLSKTTADEAARVIIDGIKAKNPRILIGSDARQISLIYRLFPTRYFAVMDRMSGGMLSKFR